MRAGGATAAALSDSLLMILRTMSQHKLVTASGGSGSSSGGGGVSADTGGSKKLPTGWEAAAGKSKKRKQEETTNGDSNGNGSGGSGSGELTSGVLTLLEGGLTRFYTQKNCRLHTKLIGEILKRQPTLGWKLAPLIVKHISNARDTYLSGEACAHIEILLQQHGAYLAAMRGGGGDGDVTSPLVPLLEEIGSELTTL